MIYNFFFLVDFTYSSSSVANLGQGLGAPSPPLPPYLGKRKKKSHKEEKPAGQAKEKQSNKQTNKQTNKALWLGVVEKRYHLDLI